MLVSAVFADVDVYALAFLGDGGLTQGAAVDERHGARSAALTDAVVVLTVDVGQYLGLVALGAVPHVIVDRVDALLGVLRRGEIVVVMLFVDQRVPQWGQSRLWRRTRFILKTRSRKAGSAMPRVRKRPNRVGVRYWSSAR